MTALRPEPRPGGRIKKASKKRPSRQLVEPVAVAFDAADWRPARPTKARLMAGR